MSFVSTSAANAPEETDLFHKCQSAVKLFWSIVRSKHYDCKKFIRLQEALDHASNCGDGKVLAIDTNYFRRNDSSFGEARFFVVFAEPNEMLSFLTTYFQHGSLSGIETWRFRAHSGVCVHEVIPAGPHKFYLDMEFEEKDPEKALFQEIQLCDLEAFYTLLCRASKDFQHAFSDTDLLPRVHINRRPGKLSAHIVFQMVSADQQTSMRIANIFHAWIKGRDINILPAFADYPNNVVHKLCKEYALHGVDAGVYSVNHSMRTIGSAKNYKSETTLWHFEADTRFSHRDLITYVNPTLRQITSDHPFLRRFHGLLPSFAMKKWQVIDEARKDIMIMADYIDRYTDGLFEHRGPFVSRAFAFIEEQFPFRVTGFKRYVNENKKQDEFMMFGQKLEGFTCPCAEEECSPYFTVCCMRRVIEQHCKGKKELGKCFFICRKGDAHELKAGIPEALLVFDRQPWMNTMVEDERQFLIPDMRLQQRLTRYVRLQDERFRQRVSLYENETDLVNFNPEDPQTLEAHRVITSVVPWNSDLVFMKSPCGSGKTNLLVALLVLMRHRNERLRVVNPRRQLKVLVITPRRSLCSSLVRTFYNPADKKHIIGEFVDYRKEDGHLDPEKTPRICIQLDSVLRVGDDSVFDLVILDEAVSLMSHILSRTMRSQKRNLVFEKLCMLFRNAEKVVAIDADMNNFAAKQIHTMCQRPGVELRTHAFMNRAKNDSATYHIIPTNGQFVVKMGEYIGQGKRFVLVCAKKEDAIAFHHSMMRLVHRLRSRNYPTRNGLPKIKIVHGDSLENDKEYFSKNASRSWRTVDILIYTSTLSVGVDHSPADAHFDAIFMVMDNAFKTESARGMLQLRWRCRKTKEDNVFVLMKPAGEKSQALFVQNPNVLAEYLRKNSSNGRDFSETLFELYCITKFETGIDSEMSRALFLRMLEMQVKDPRQIIHVEADEEHVVSLAEKGNRLEKKLYDYIRLQWHNKGAHPQKPEDKEREIMETLSDVLSNPWNWGIVLEPALIYFMKNSQKINISLELERFLQASSYQEWESEYKRSATSDVMKQTMVLKLKLGEDLLRGAFREFGALEDSWDIYKCLDSYVNFTLLHDKKEIRIFWDNANPTSARSFPLWLEDNYYDLQQLGVNVNKKVQPNNKGSIYRNVLKQLFPFPLYFGFERAPSNILPQIVDLLLVRNAQKRQQNEQTITGLNLHYLEKLRRNIFLNGSALTRCFINVLGNPTNEFDLPEYDDRFFEDGGLSSECYDRLRDAANAATDRPADSDSEIDDIINEIFGETGLPDPEYTVNQATTTPTHDTTHSRRGTVHRESIRSPEGDPTGNAAPAPSRKRASPGGGGRSRSRPRFVDLEAECSTDDEEEEVVGPTRNNSGVGGGTAKRTLRFEKQTSDPSLGGFIVSDSEFEETQDGQL